MAERPEPSFGVRARGRVPLHDPDLQAQDTRFANTTNYPVDALRKLRQAVEDVFEHETTTRRAFRPRGRRYITDGPDSSTIQLPNLDVLRIAAASVNGVALTAPELAAILIRDDGTITRTSSYAYGTSWGTGVGGAMVLYEYGFRPCPMTSAAKRSSSRG